MKNYSSFNLVLHVFIGFCVIVWGSSYVAVQIGLEDFSPSQLAAYRFTVASAVLLPTLVFKKISVPKPKEWLYILAIASAGIVIYHIALNYSSVYYPATSVSFVANSMPIFAIIIATLFLGEQTSLLGWIGVLLAMIGIGLLNYEGLRSLDLEMLMLIIIPISSAVFFVFQKPLLKTLRSYEVMFYSILVGTLVLLVLDHSFLIVIPKAAISTNLAAIYLGLIPTAIAFNLWAYVLSKLEVSYTSRYLYLVPVFTVFFSFIILNQIPKQNVLLGGGIILFGVYLSQRK